MHPSELIDLDRYPITDPESADGRAFREHGRLTFKETGLLALDGFLRQTAIAEMAAEARALEYQAHFVESTHNVYLATEPEKYSGQGPAGRAEQTFVGSVAYDHLPRRSHLRRLYEWDPLMQFIQSVIGAAELHRFVDPLGACSINVYTNGGQHGWHFDESELSITLMLQAPESGGEFEYVPGIRHRDDEEAVLSRVLDGDSRETRQLPFTTGTLLIFNGQHTLHRVTRVTGPRARLVPVLCFSEQPGMINSDEVRKYFWGRTA